SSGGVFDTYAVVQGIDRFIPVDVYVPGCPTRPEQLIRAVLDLQEKVQRTGTINAREFEKRTAYEGPGALAKEVDADDLVVTPGNYKTGTRLRLN
ncbi:MAG: NADH-quinone oxidoreductase subunit B, partial [Fimbriiglobus sp.]